MVTDKLKIYDLLFKSEKSKKAKEELAGVHFCPFVEAIAMTMSENYGYKLPYIQVCVGLTVNNGIRTWHDLMCLTTEEIMNKPRLNKKLKVVLVEMKDHEVWAANTYATYATFNNYIGGIGHYKRLMKYFNDRLFTYERLKNIPQDELKKIKGIGKATIDFLNRCCIEHESIWNAHYQDNLNWYYSYFLEKNV